MQKPSNPKGTRDFTPREVRNREAILNIIKDCFRRFGFEPIETPAFENLSTLTGKYGAEGDKLLFRILNSGDVYSKLSMDKIQSNHEMLSEISKKGLRYDLTVPFARYVVQHSNELVFPFRRYQIQPVWRADRPGKGRFQEFTQCDADIIGSNSLLGESELLLIYSEVLEKLGLGNAVLRINHRKLLEALIQKVGISQDMNWFTSTLDKLDKIGNKGIKQEFEKAGLNEMQTADILNLVETNPLNSASLHHIRKQFGASSLVESALSDLNEILTFIADRKLSISVEIDLSLARGLDYYTGCIFEVVVPESGIGSISGGGRYDDLTGVFGLKNVSGVGISFGIDRIYEILSNSDSPLFTEDHSDMILLCHFDEPSRQYVFNIAADLRDKGFNAYVYPDLKKLQKQLDYANKKRVKWVLIAGEEEMQKSNVTVKNMQSGENTAVALQELALILS